MMKLCVAVLLLAVYCPPTWADTCTACKTAYGTPDAGAKCTPLKTYLQCLDGSAKDDAGCPLTAADAGTIETDFTGDSCSFTDTCVCQKDFWKTDQSAAQEADTCSATQTYIICLKGKTALACDGTTIVTALATAVETRMKALDNPACSVTTACQCEINAAKADISDDAKKCTAYKAQFECLSPLTTAPCVSSTSIESLKAAAATAVTSTTSCTVTTTCRCELNAAKADISTDAKKCAVLTTLKTCLSAITTSTETGCTTLTQAELVTDTDTKITTAKCGSFADHVSYTMTSLIIPVLVHLFM